MDIVTQDEVDDYLSDQLKNSAPTGGTPAAIITDVSRRIALFTGRTDFGPQQSRTEYFDGDTSFLLPRVWPIISITSIADDTDHVWDSDSLLDATDYWISQNASLENNNGIVYLETKLNSGHQSVKMVYTGGYAAISNIPARLKQAALMQIAYEVRIDTNAGFSNLAKTVNGMTVEPSTGVGLLSQVQMMLQDFRRRISFA